MKCCLIFLLASFFLHPISSYSQSDDLINKETDFDLPVIVITGSRLEISANSAVSKIKTIYSADIKKLASQNIVDVLKTNGVYVSQPGGNGGFASVFIRGADPNFTLVLIDGVKANDPTNTRGGSFDFSTLDVNTVDRIEIIKGPVSSVYGSGSISGVVNIITKKANGKNGGTYTVRDNFDGYHYAALTYANVGEVTSNNFGVSYNDTGIQQSKNEQINRNFFINGGWGHPGLTSISWNVRHINSDSESFPDDSGGYTFSVNRELEMRAVDETVFGFNLNKTLSESAKLSLISSIFKHDEKVDSPVVEPGLRDPFGVPSSTTDNKFTRYTITTACEYKPLNQFRGILGLNTEVEDGSTKGFIDFGGFSSPSNFKLNRSNYSIFSETEAAFNNGIILHGGLRVDVPDGYSDRLSSNIGVLYRLEGIGTTFRLNYGEGYKLPSFFALGNPIVGNSALKPETSESLSLNIEQTLWNGKALVELDLFTQKFKNIIDFEEGPPPRLINRSQVSSKGIEATFSLNPTKKVSFFANAAYIDTNIEGSEERLRNRPEWSGGANLSLALRNNLALSIGVIHTGKVFDSSIPTGDLFLDDYTRVDISSTWRVFKNLTLSLSVENALDVDYEETIGFPSEGITSRLSFNGLF